MTYNNYKVVAASLALGMIFIAQSALTAKALSLNTSVSGSASVSPSGANAGVTVQANLMIRAKDHANREIDRRNERLTAVSARIDAMVKISDSEKASLKTSLQNQISAMTALKAKIDADTDAATLKTDVQSITKAYRIYVLVIPQGTIMAAADRGTTVAGDLSAIGTKLQARISAAQASGTDVTAMQSVYADFTAKISDANTMFTAAITEVSSLTPDNGDQAKFQANLTAMKDARTKIQTAHADLVAARKDAGTIVKDLKIDVHASASSSATVY